MKQLTTLTLSFVLIAGCSSGAQTQSTGNHETAPALTFTATPTTVASGASTTLSWSASGATGCAASGAWTGNRSTSGSITTTALTAALNEFTLVCSGSGGSASQTVVVTVAAVAPAPTVSLEASPTSLAAGGSATLTWTSVEAESCTASGAWSGSQPTSGSASTGALMNARNVFTLTCNGLGGSASSSATVTVQGGVSVAGLDFQGNASTERTVRFRFTNPLAIYPATYIWKVRPRQQAGYYTTFFWGNDGPFIWGPGSPDSYYGAHPYPDPAPNGSSHRWEIAAYAGDYQSSESVVYDVWYTQALRVWADSSGKHHEFYWDLPDTSRVIRVDLPTSYASNPPPSPALTFGDAPWNESNEILNGVLRGIQIYSATLSFNDILAESADPLSTSAGAANIWYLNLNPTPTDISDKSGAEHHPEWVGVERPRLWTGP